MWLMHSEPTKPCTLITTDRVSTQDTLSFIHKFISTHTHLLTHFRVLFVGWHVFCTRLISCYYRICSETIPSSMNPMPCHFSTFLTPIMPTSSPPSLSISQDHLLFPVPIRCRSHTWGHAGPETPTLTSFSQCDYLQLQTSSYNAHTSWLAMCAKPPFAVHLSTMEYLGRFPHSAAVEMSVRKMDVQFLKGILTWSLWGKYPNWQMWALGRESLLVSVKILYANLQWPE